ncbi:MAG: lysylphosphatidylglycerol synthase transmembrane domain-containing protein [bacterium]|mgnify:CR=1 FL=1
MKTSHKQIWFGAVLSLALVILLLKSTDFHALSEAFRHANYYYCIPMIAISLIGILIRAYRWKFIMAPLHRASMSNLFSATMVGFMAIDLLPARIGEVIRAHLIGEKEGIPKSAAFGTIVVERLFDIFTVLLILAWILVIVSLPGSRIQGVYAKALRGAALVFFPFFVVLICFLILIMRKTGLAISWARTCLRPLPESWRNKILSMLNSFASGLGAIRMGMHLVPIIFYSLIMWGLFGLGNGLMLKAFQIDLPVYAFFYLLVVQAVAVAVPASPGFVGTYHAAVVAGLAAFQIPKEVALSFAILSHFLIFIPVILYGLVLLWKDHLSLSTLKTKADDGQNGIPKTK